MTLAEVEERLEEVDEDVTHLRRLLAMLGSMLRLELAEEGGGDDGVSDAERG